MLVSIQDIRCTPSLKRQTHSLRRRMYLHSNGILTVSPFPNVRLGARLGSTYSQLIDIAEKPLSLSVPETLTLY